MPTLDRRTMLRLGAAALAAPLPLRHAEAQALRDANWVIVPNEQRVTDVRYHRSISLHPGNKTIEADVTFPIPASDELKSKINRLVTDNFRLDLQPKILKLTLDSLQPTYTLDAATKFGAFDKPVLIAWGVRDRFFPLAEGERLAAAFPRGQLERIDNARTFVQMDAPERLAELILERVPAAAG